MVPRHLDGAIWMALGDKPKRNLFMHTLETQRLILKPPSQEDVLRLHTLHSDPFVVQAIRDGIYPTIEQTKAAQEEEDR